MTALPGADVRTTLPGFTYNTAQPNVAYAAITRDSIRDNLVALRSLFCTPEGLPAFNPTDNFSANEKSHAASAQGRSSFDLAPIIVDVLLGLRAVKTKSRISFLSRTAGPESVRTRDRSTTATV